MLGKKSTAMIKCMGGLPRKTRTVQVSTRGMGRGRARGKTDARRKATYGKEQYEWGMRH